MATFHVKSLSDEDIALILDMCTTRLLLAHEKDGVREWVCPVCGRQMRLSEPVSLPNEHLRPEYVNAWS